MHDNNPAQSTATSSASVKTTPPPSDRARRAPLSYAQQRLWFLDKLQTTTSAYNELRAYEFLGPLDVASLTQALNEMVRRHECLRTTFADGAEPVQVCGAQWPALKLPIVDLSHTPPNGIAPEIDNHVREFVRPRFDLSRDLMLRTTLLRFGPEHHVLLRVIHHIATDGWSSGVFWSELAALYSSVTKGAPSPLTELSIQYADYAEWQKHALDGEHLHKLLAYWNGQLRGMPPQFDLPTDRPRPPIATYQGSRVPVAFSAALTEQLQLLSRRERATLFMTLLAGWQSLFSRYNDVTDIVVGAHIAGRNRADLEGVIGVFVNTLLLRTDLSGDPTFLEVLQRARRVALDAYAHPDLPFERLVEELRPERSLAQNPLCQVAFAFQNTPQRSADFNGVTVRELDVVPETSKFDLTLSLNQGSQGLSGWVEYSSDLFDRETVVRMVGHLQMLFEGVVADPRRRLSEFPLPTSPECVQLLVDFNDTAAPFPRDGCVHDIFEQQVALTPDATAVVFDGQQLSYHELNSRANQLARYLRSLGVGPETLVGLCLERSFDLVIGILGIWKAGAAYVPLDANYPTSRLEFMLGDAKIEYLVTHEALRRQVPPSKCRTVCLDEDKVTIEAYDSAKPQVQVAADNLAYVMYTSGSTGRPKGVQIPHSAVVNLLLSMADEPGMTAADRLLCVTTPTFDISVLELWLPLITGASVEVVPSSAAYDPAALRRHLENRDITVMQATPETWRMLINDGWAGDQSLKALCGGEALPHDVARFLAERCGTLWNMYGPTETTIWSVIRQVAPDDISDSIGRPIANTHAYVLDARQQLVPIGVPGELLLGGAGLARGYLNRAELTAERFIANPFSNDAGSRLYRTGDRCRWRADGTLEFQGRLDHQIKLRGFRIELGEIESVIREDPAVDQCVVALREDVPGEKRLVAYCVSAHGARLQFSEMARRLRGKLPHHMTPSAYVDLAEMPHTANGKLNRAALPPPGDTRPELEIAYTAPRGSIEQRLSEMWRELLQLDSVGIDDDFFHLGGHSLLAVQLFARIEQAFGRKLPLAVLFQQGTIRNLAALLAESAVRTDLPSVVPLQPKGAGCPLFLLPSIGGELLFARHLVEALGEQHPVYGLQPALSAENIEQFRELEVTATNFVTALREFQPQGPYALAGYSYGGLVAFEMACQLHDLGERVDLLAILDNGPGDRGRAPQRVRPGRWLANAAANLPSYAWEELLTFSPTRLWHSATRKLNHLYRRSWHRIQNGQGASPKLELDDVFGVMQIPSQNHELMRAVYAAFRDYVPRAYSGELTLFRAATRSLLGRFDADLGWGRFVSSIDIRRIAGNHDTILTPPRVQRLAEDLRQRLDELESARRQ